MKQILMVAVSLMCLSTVLAAKGGGKPQGETLAAACDDLTPMTESCTVTGQHLVAGKTYQLEATTNCADNETFSGTADSAGNVVFTIQLAETDIPGFCQTNTFFFYLFVESSKGTQLKLVATTALAEKD